MARTKKGVTIARARGPNESCDREPSSFIMGKPRISSVKQYQRREGEETRSVAAYLAFTAPPYEQ